MSYIKADSARVAGVVVRGDDGSAYAVETMAVVSASGDLVEIGRRQAAGVAYKISDGSAIPIRAIALVDDNGDAITGVVQQPAIADVGAAPTQADFNGLLAALRSAGILAAS